MELTIDGRKLTAPARLSTADAVSLRVTFSPRTPGPVSASIYLKISALTTQSLQIPIRALVLEQPKCQIDSYPGRIDFGESALGQRAAKTLQIYNSGHAACQVTSISVSQDTFSIQSPVVWSMELAPGQSQQLSLAYFPQSEGNHLATLIVESSAEKSLEVPLRGRATEAQRLPSIEPPELHFGNRGSHCQNPTSNYVYVSTPREAQVIQAWLGPGTSEAFRLVSSRPKIKTDGRAEIGIQFTPDASGSYRGELWVKVGERPASLVPLFATAGMTSSNRQTLLGRPPYRLFGPPMPGSVKLYQGGTPIPRVLAGQTHWGVNYPEQTIVFSEAHLPAEGARLEAHYEILCVPSTCGDGQRDDGEICDDGNLVQTDGCLNTCIRAYCGDGFVRSGYEDCDDGNDIAGDGCSLTCRAAICGNGLIEQGEQCDLGFGNAPSPNTCRTNCQLPSCGDAIVDPAYGEQCDDGNTDTSDGCVSCVQAFCGDGHLFSPYEECDDGNQVARDGCESNCQLTRYTVEIAPGDIWSGSGRYDKVGYETEVSIPFPFSFLGTVVSTVDLSVPGIIGFKGPAAYSPVTNQAIPSPLNPNGYIAWWWDDLLNKGKSPYAWTEGSPGAETWVLRFEELQLIDPQAPEQTIEINVEVRLSQAHEAVLIQYGQIETNGQHLGSATVGWESISGEDGEDPLHCSPHCTTEQWPELLRVIYRP